MQTTKSVSIALTNQKNGATLATVPWNPAALSLYRRALRIRRLLVDPPLRRRFVYNIREMISLFRYPHQVQAFKPSPSPLSSSHTSEHVSPPPSTRRYYEAKVQELIHHGHQDLTLIESILRSEPRLVSALISTFHPKKDAESLDIEGTH